MCEFVIPGTQNTTVLVVEATSSIVRIVVRKLMLRDYTVKALVRKADQEVVDMLPKSVEIVTGDVVDPATLRKRAKGIVLCRLFAASVFAGKCLILVYRVSHVPKAGANGRFGWIGLLGAQIWFAFYWLLTQASRWRTLFIGTTSRTGSVKGTYFW